MKFPLPVRKVTINSKLAPDDVIKRLSEKVHVLVSEGIISPSLAERQRSAYFSRKVIGNQFTISYTNWNGKPGMTITSGTISRNENGSTISLDIRITPLFMFFLTVIVMLPVFFFIKDFGMVLISAKYAFSKEATPWSFVPILIPVSIMYSLAMFGFSAECSRVKKFMLTLIDGWEERPLE